jgi:rare lipoprotein A (peptidoglycan hydrolase)
VNDRGPYDCEVVDNKVLPLYPLRPHPSRVLDLSREAMVQIGGYADGVVPISYIISDD